MQIEHVYIEPREVAEKHLQVLLDAGMNFLGKRVLDLGCGTGTYTKLISELGTASVVGIDKVLSNIRIAQEINRGTNIEFVSADIDEWKIKEYFDFIFIRGTIYYMKAELHEIVANLSKILNPEGELFITFMDSSRKAALINTIKQFSAKTPEILRPCLHMKLSALYYVLAMIIAPNKPRWDTVKNKMNTVFFPLRHLTDLETAASILNRHGFFIKDIFRGQGQNPSLSNEYGIWAKMHKSKAFIDEKVHDSADQAYDN